MTETSVPGRLTPEQIEGLQAVLVDSDSVELKLTVPDADQRSAVQALGLDPLDAEVRQVYFFDTPDLVLNQHGVIVRARRTKSGDDTVVKRRPVVPHELPADLRALKGFGVEVDAMPGGFVCSASLKGKLRAGKVKKTVSGERSLHSLFTKKQRAFFAQSAPEGIDLDELATLGPITVMKLKYSPDGFDGKLVAELWFYPDTSRILELSTKTTPSDAFGAADRTRDFLKQRGVDLSGEQQTKTKTALEFFSAELRQGT